MKTFLIRLATGLMGTAIIVFLFLWSKYTFALAMGVMLIGSLHEYFTLIEKPGSKPASFLQGKWLVIALCFIVFVKAFVLASPSLSFSDSSSPYFFKTLLQFRDSTLALNVILPTIIALLFIIELYSKAEKPFENIGKKVIAVFWILVPVLLTINIYFKEGAPFVLAMFFIIWFYDSFCYIFGSLFGKTKLFERVSPKKTWEGAIGGAVVTLIVFYFANKIPPLQNYSAAQWEILAAVIIVTSTYGDLVESLLKRNLGLKDSGSIMPGHGGFLDRLDSFYIAIPFVTITLWVYSNQ